MAYQRTRNLNPDFIKFVVPLLPPPNKDPDAPLDVEKARGAMGAMTEGKRRALEGPWKHLLTAVKIENVLIPMRDGHKVELRVIKPTDAGESLSIYYSLHGGGFIGGNNDTEELINRQLAYENKVVVFSLDYRLAPEHDITTIYNDAEDGAKWVYTHASEYGGDVGKDFLVGGTSSGALLASAIAFRAPSLGLPVKGLLLRQGVFVLREFKDEWKPRFKSLEENADAPLLNANDVRRLNKAVYIDPVRSTDPWYFPIFAAHEDLSKLPRTYLVAAGCDPVVDQVYILRDLLDEAGVETKLSTYEGMPHGFHAFHNLKPALAEMKETAQGLSWLLGSAS